MKLIWNNLVNKTDYNIEKYMDYKFNPISNNQTNETIFTDSELSANTLYIYRIKTIITINTTGFNLNLINFNKIKPII